MVEIEQVKEYLRVDFDEDNLFIEQLIEISMIYIDSLVGESYKENEKKVKLAEFLQLLIIADMYENRSLEVKECSMNKIAHSILDKLSI